MTHQSEERLPDSAAATPSASTSARILQFERPQSELQRAIQQRAQEALDIDRDRDREKKKPQPLKWTVIFLIALIPVVLIFTMVDGFLRVFHRINASYNSAPPAAEQQQEPAEPVLQSSEPGVVLLQPYEVPSPPEARQPAEQAAPAESQDGTAKN